LLFFVSIGQITQLDINYPIGPTTHFQASPLIPNHVFIKQVLHNYIMGRFYGWRRWNNRPGTQSSNYRKFLHRRVYGGVL